MATLLHSESRRMYSWWWSSHISPKNSKWLQENLTDMDSKVKAMIKLIEEDADSFARRAEMYYKRRPELMKLVEEFYRAYRALAERYNHATKELRQAHRTMAEAFPDQVPYSLTDESPSSNSSAPDPPEIPHSIAAFLDSGDLHSAKKGLQQVHDMFESKEAEAEEQLKAETEIQTLKGILAQIQADKESILTEYQNNLEKLAGLKGELDHAQQDAKGLDERASKAEIEIKVLKEAHLRLESERDAWLLRFNQSAEMISKLEAKLSLVEKNKQELNEQAVKAETECQYLKQEISRLEADKEAGLVQYRQCLETISALESRISLAELDARKISEKAEKAEGRIKELEEAVAKLNEEKEAVAFLYKQCLEALAKMEAELSRTQVEAKRLNTQLLEDAAKLKNAEEQCSTLEISNQTLQSEAQKLAQRIAVKESELLRKNEELEKFKTCLSGEQLRFDQVDASLEALQKLQHQSQEEQRALALEIRSGLQMLRDLESRKDGLEEEIRQVKEENRSLSEINLSTSVSEESLRCELSNLRDMKAKLEEDFAFQTVKSETLQREVCQLREEIKGLSSSYEALLLQIESVGLDPEKLVLSVKELQDENLKLRTFHEEETERINEKLKRMDSISEKNSTLEKSLSELNGALHESREVVKQFQESCQSLQGEKSVLAAEKASLLSQLLSVTENMQKLVEKNTSLETSFSAGKAEVEGLREKSKRVDEFCQLLIDEKCSLVNERSALALHLNNVEQRLTNVETRFTNLEEKCSRLEMEKDATLSQVEELRGYLGSEKQERAAYVQSSETRLSGLENHVNLLQEEIHLRKKDFEEEVEKAVNAQLEIFILQRFVEDLEEKNLSLLFECQKHVESSKMSKKLISELEGENLEQQVELEMLSDEISKLRTEIYQVFKALQIDPEIWYRDEVAKESIGGLHHKRSPLHHILEKIEKLKSSLSKNKDENTKLAIENSMLFAVIEQVRSDGAELDSSKKLIEEEVDFMIEECTMLEKERDELLEVNKQLKVRLAEVELQQEAIVEENAEIHEENQGLKEKIIVMQEQNRVLGEENDEILNEALSLANLSVVFQSFGIDKTQELIQLHEGIHSLHNANSDLKEEMRDLAEQLQMKREENHCLVDSVEKLSGELHEEKDLNDQLNHQIIMGNDFLREKAKELSEVEQKLEWSRCSSLELSRTVEELNRDHKESKLCREMVENQIQALCEEAKDKDKVIKKLVEVNKNLEIEIERLREEVEEGRIREENLCSELQERSNEFEIWEAEASSFYFDLQISAVNEVLLENKVHELTEICETLKGSSNAKGQEIEQMKVRVEFLESEIGELKSQLGSCIPVISSLRDDMPSLKQNAALWRQHCADSKLEKDDEDIFANEGCEEGKTTVVGEMTDLQKMNCRIEAVERAVMEEKGRLNIQRDEDEKCPRVTKDIPLDHVSNTSFSGRSRRTVRAKYHTLSPEADYMLRKQSSKPMADDEIEGEEQKEEELAIEDKLEISSSRELEKEVNKRKILERLSSDAQKLTGLQISLQDIRKKAEMKKSKNVKLEGLKMQLQDLQETVVQLLIINDHLRKDMDGNDDGPYSVDDKSVVVAEEEEEDIERVRERKVREQAKRESEKIERLQFEVQDIQYVLLKMEDDKKMKMKMKMKVVGGNNNKTSTTTTTTTGIMLRDFIKGTRRGGSSSRKLKKGCFCGCSRVKGD